MRRSRCFLNARTLQLSLDSTSIEQIRIEFVLRILELLMMDDFLGNNFVIQKILLDWLYHLLKSRSNTLVWKRLLAHVRESVFGKETSAYTIRFGFDPDKLANFSILHKKLMKSRKFHKLRKSILQEIYEHAPETTPKEEVEESKGPDIKVTQQTNILNMSMTSNEEETDDPDSMRTLESMVSFNIFDSLILQVFHKAGNS